MDHSPGSASSPTLKSIANTIRANISHDDEMARYEEEQLALGGTVVAA
jgi:GGDEF domain-containing protein